MYLNAMKCQTIVYVMNVSYQQVACILALDRIIFVASGNTLRINEKLNSNLITSLMITILFS